MFDVAESTGKNSHMTGRICPYCLELRPEDCQRVTDHFRTALQQYTANQMRSTPLTHGQLRTIQRSAASKLAKLDRKNGNTARSSLPLLRDVIVHFQERQPEMGLHEIYRVRSAIEAVHGEQIMFHAVAAQKEPVENPILPVSSAQLAVDYIRQTTWFRSIREALRVVYFPNRNDALVGAPDIPDLDDSAALVIVLGSSLQVLKHYAFLWPQGLTRSLLLQTTKGDTEEVKKCTPKDHRRTSLDGVRCSRRSIDRQFANSPLQQQQNRCGLVIINLQPTCKDGLADLVVRAPCDDFLHLVLHDCLQITVPEYDVSRDDSLYRNAVPLTVGEEYTRSRPDIPFDRFVLHG